MIVLIYHICRRDEWASEEKTGSYAGSSQDLVDGFIHFSTASQVRASAAKHRAGQTDLMLLSVDPDSLSDALKWEPSRGRYSHIFMAICLCPGDGWTPWSWTQMVCTSS